MDWASFWGAIIGGLLGAITTIIAFRCTYNQNEKQYKQNFDANAQQHKDTQERIDKQTKAAVLPFLDAEAYGNGKYFNGFDYFVDNRANLQNDTSKLSNLADCIIGISNIGQASAIGVTFKLNNRSTIAIGNIPKDEMISLHIIAIIEKSIENDCTLEFRDIANHRYTQTFKIRRNNGPNIKITTYSTMPTLS